MPSDIQYELVSIISDVRFRRSKEDFRMIVFETGEELRWICLL